MGPVQETDQMDPFLLAFYFPTRFYVLLLFIRDELRLRNEGFRGRGVRSQSFPDEINSQTGASLSVSGRKKKKKKKRNKLVEGQISPC